MTQPAKSQEPSMEEILASIRRIIADDDATKSPQRAPEPPKAEAQPAGRAAASGSGAAVYPRRRRAARSYFEAEPPPAAEPRADGGRRLSRTKPPTFSI